MQNGSGLESGNIEKEVIFAVTSRIALVSQELVTQEFCLPYNTFMCCYIWETEIKIKSGQINGQFVMQISNQFRGDEKKNH